MTSPAILTTTDKPVELWTFQGPDHSLTIGHIDHEVSPYKDEPHITAASRKLWGILGEDQLIWCYTRYKEFSGISIPTVRWNLSVPQRAILRFVNGYMWSRIIKRTTGIAVPENLRRQLRQNFQGDRKKQDVYEATMSERFWREPESEKEQWVSLFVPSPDGREGIDALLKHPIDPDWVILQENSHNEDGSSGLSRQMTDSRNTCR